MNKSMHRSSCRRSLPFWLTELLAFLIIIGSTLIITEVINLLLNHQR